MKPETVIIQFAKEPLLGKVKTRMSPVLSSEQSVCLHQSLVRHCMKQLSSVDLAEKNTLSVELWVGSNPENNFFSELASQYGIPIFLQQGDDLGERLFHAVATTLNRVQQVIIVGSDCPFFTATYLNSAVALLNSGKEVVLGPANDGGYVLVGMSVANKKIFSDVNWGSGEVLAQTKERINDAALSYGELDPLDDIDRPEDLAKIPFDWRE